MSDTSSTSQSAPLIRQNALNTETPLRASFRAHCDTLQRQKRTEIILPEFYDEDEENWNRQVRDYQKAAHLFQKALNLNDNGNRNDECCEEREVKRCVDEKDDCCRNEEDECDKKCNIVSDIVVNMFSFKKKD